MKLMRSGVVFRSEIPSEPTKTWQLGWGGRFVWVFAIIASVCLTSSSARADRRAALSDIVDDIVADEADCENSCNIQKLKDKLACGRVAESCFKRIIYIPWWMSKSIRYICETNQSSCEMRADTNGYLCYGSCMDEANRRIMEEERKLRELQFLDDHA
jgi:hypothetical protein